MYPPCDVDKVRERGETWAVDPETSEALDRLGADLRGEIRSTAAETRAYIGERIQTSEAETRAYVDERLQTFGAETFGYVGERLQTSGTETRAYIDERLQLSTASLLHQMCESEDRTRRHFDVVAESLRGEIRSVAELVALSNEQGDRRDDEQAARSDGLDGRVLRLEVRVSGLEADRKPRRPRRR